MRDPNTVAAIVNVLRQVHGDDLARFMLNDGFSLAILIDALLRSPLKNRDAVKLITRALSSGDFLVTPDFGSPSPSSMLQIVFKGWLASVLMIPNVPCVIERWLAGGVFEPPDAFCEDDLAGECGTIRK